MLALSTRLPRANQPGRIHSEAMQQQSDNLKFCINFCQPSFRPPTVTPGTNFTILTIIATTYQYSPPDTSTITTTTTNSDGGSVLNCPHSDHTFNSCIGLVGHLRIQHTETGEPVPGSTTHSRDRRIHCPHCPYAFSLHIGLFGHMRIHESGINRNVDNTDTP
ncbi:unnamed protein product [Schistocephalus solidus]|uniref:C2H2-type domain-containing protein n=1 Tax=Schistocephalus solidus TaxID=70667 RepID=A0A183SXC6_SCHSO|nr:unnamed protein product [Schistocephalus solidus]